VEAQVYNDSALKRSLITAAVCAMTVACGVPSAKSPSTSQALTSSAEWLEFEPVSVRQELFRDVARQSQAQAGHAGAVLFPMLVGGGFIAAPALEGRLDLLGASGALDAGAPLRLAFDRVVPFAEDRREAFQGLSEREVAEQVARSLLQHWRLAPQGAVTVVRVAGAPYAAAWIDGELRLNPSFLYMAAAPMAQ
jgi:hypothetical protein